MWIPPYRDPDFWVRVLMVIKALYDIFRMSP
jgi:hypothetical protein